MSAPGLSPIMLLPAILGLGRGLRSGGGSPASSAKADSAVASQSPRIRAQKLGVPSADDLPRNNLGWPTIEPREMTLQQLLNEGESWRRTAVDAPGCVGDGEFRLYAAELVRRQFLDELDVRQWRRDGAPEMVYMAPNPDFPNQKRWVPVFPADRSRS